MIDTERLFLFPLKYKQLELYLLNDGSLEKELKCQIIEREFDEDYRELLEYDKLPELNRKGKINFFKTIWLAKNKNTNTLVADIFFRNIPNEIGSVEIGYSTFPEFRNQGIMKEMVNGFVNWAFKNPTVKIIRVETLKTNIASEKVLVSNGFKILKENSIINFWIKEKIKNSSTFAP